MQIHGIQGRNYDSNIYIITGKKSTIIDTGTGLNQDTVTKKIKEIIDPTSLHQIILTHEHYDHCGGLKNIYELANENAVVIAHPHAAAKIENGESMFASMLGGTMPKMPIDQRVNEKDHITIGNDTFTVLHTPGHTPGCICLHSEKEKVLFSGDTVFANGSFGRTDLPGGNHQELQQSIQRLATLDIMTLFPGHEDWVEQNAHQHIKQSLQNISSFG